MSAHPAGADLGSASGLGRPRRLLDHLAVVRSHWLVFSLVFLVCLGGILALALFKTPAVTAAATVEISSGPSAGRFLPSLGAPEALRKMDNEVATTVSLDLARVVAADKTAHLTCVLEEEAIHRVLDLFLRSVGRGREPCLLDLTTPDEPLRGEAALEEYRLRFDLSGKNLTVERVKGGEPQAIPAFGFDKPFRAFNRTFLLAPKPEHRGAHAGRSFLASVRSYESAARWVHAGVFAAAHSREGDMLRIGFASRDPELARLVADACARNYIDQGRRRYHEDLQTALGALNEQIRTTTAELLVLDNERDAFVQKHDAVYLSSEKIGLLNSEPTRAAEVQQLAQALKTLDGDHERLLKLRDLPLSDSVDEILSMQQDALLQGLWANVRSLQRQRAQTLKAGKVLEGHSEIVAIDVQIDALQDEIKTGLARMYRLSEERHARDRGDLSERLERSKEAHDKIRKRLDAIPSIERELGALQGRVDAKRAILDGLLERQSALQVLQGTNHSPMRLLEQAIAGAPDYSLLRSALLALLVAVALGALATIALDALRGGLRSPEELESLLGVPVYAAVPDIRTAPRRDRRGVRHGLIALYKPRSGLAECYWQLRAKLLFMGPERRVRSLAVTSATELEGKSITALNLAGVLAQAGATVVVVDGDLRLPQCHKHLQLALSPGLSEVLRETSTLELAVQPSRFERVHLLSAGSAVGNPGALLDAARVAHLIEGLRKRFDYVIVDLPPVLAVADAAGALRAFDGVLLVVRARKTPAAKVEEAKRELEQLGARILGAVFNAYDMRRFKGRSYGYGRYRRDEADREEPVVPPVRLKHVDAP